VATDGEGGTVSGDESDLAPDAGEVQADERLEALAPGSALARFTLERRLGSGAMGEVWAARDPELDRTVAVKVLAPRWTSARARVRLLREAQALAKLRHENVVTVFDVGEERGRLYIAMELAEGQTLADWLRAKQRSWREVRDVFVAAGRGLAAAHAAGIVHRDFKPGNVLVGAAGVRVVDFGLAARGDEPASVDSGGSPEAADIRLTRTGKLVGTPVYMSPEQLRGERATPRSDQWSFCVALHEALYGRRPFAGEDVPALASAIARGPRFAAGPPRSLVAILRRGLRVDPEARFPSMDALVAKLRPRRTRDVVVAAAAAMVAASVAAFVLGRQMMAPPACARADERIVSVWDEATRARVADAFRRTGRPYADDTFARVDAALRRRLADWANVHRDACEATHVRGEQSESMLDLRMRCLLRARAEISALVSLLAEADAGALDRAAQAAAHAGDIPACSDLAALAAAAPLPRDPALARQVEDLRQDEHRIAALRRLGKWKDALAAARDLVVRARKVGYAPVSAWALVVTGELELDAGDTDAAIDVLYDAARMASEAKDDELVASALNNLVYAFGDRKQRFDVAELAYRLAAAATARAGNTPKLLARLYTGRAWALEKKGDYAAVLPLRQLVLALEEQLYGPDSLEVAKTLGEGIAGTLNQLGRRVEAATVYARAIAITERALGPMHPRVGVLLNNFGGNRLQLGEYDAAAQLLERSLRIKEDSLGPDDLSVAFTCHWLASARREQRRLAEARALAQRTIQIRERRLGPENPMVAASYEILATVSFTQGNLDEAHRSYRQAISIYHKAYGPAHPLLGWVYAGDGDVLVAQGRLREAREAVERAIDIHRRALGEEHPDFANALRSLADLLRAEGRFPDSVHAYQRTVALTERAYGPNTSLLIDPLVGLCHALLGVGDARAAVQAGERGVALAEKAPPDVDGGARFCLAKARWAEGGDRSGALALARETRAKLAALPFPSRDLPDIDRWLARVSEGRSSR
jgi:tetratricopeptide (TPR) repeat protein/predicted Ser/Thr protein kinase